MRSLAAALVVAACVLAREVEGAPRPSGASTTSTALDGRRVRFAELELAGPLRSLELVQAGRERALVRGELAAGETVRVQVPVPVSAVDPDAAPRASWDVGASDDHVERGRARFAYWIAEDPALERVPVALRARPRPPVDAARPEASLASVAVLVATFLVVLALRRRPLAALGVAAVGAAAASLGVRSSRPDPAGGLGARATVLEGLAGEDTWLAVRAGAGVLELERATDGVARERVEVEPGTAELHVDGDLRGAAPWRLSARGARLFALSTRPALAIERGGTNDALDLDAAWERVDGAWRALGPWRKGSVAPSAPEAASPEASTASAPPGWLAAGLPQGVDVLLGRFAATDGRAEPRWLRLVGW